ncbi:MAG: hypothetical protein ABIQ31_12240 [Ferruginibacter sp.]
MKTRTEAARLQDFVRDGTGGAGELVTRARINLKVHYTLTSLNQR